MFWKKQVPKGHSLPRECRERDKSAYIKWIIKGHSQTRECRGRNKLAYRK